MIDVIIFPAVFEGDSEGDLQLQHEGPAPKHVGVETGISPLQTACPTDITPGWTLPELREADPVIQAVGCKLQQQHDRKKKGSNVGMHLLVHTKSIKKIRGKKNAVKLNVRLFWKTSGVGYTCNLFVSAKRKGVR